MLAKIAGLNPKLIAGAARIGTYGVNQVSMWTKNQLRAYSTVPSNPTSTSTVNKHPVQTTVCWVRAQCDLLRYCSLFCAETDR